MLKNQVLKLNKNIGETPLECIQRFTADNPEYKNEKMTYAGRLDPLASGLLLVLSGEECKNKEKYLGLDKEYELTILFGFKTDSMDLLGLIEDSREGSMEKLGHYKKADFEKILEKFEKSFSQKYPKYSSPVICGKKPEDIPEKEVSIKKIIFQSFGLISKKYLWDMALKNIFLVKGNFRQNMIWAKWEKTLEYFTDKNLPTLTIRVSCTSGTYMRALAQAVGEEVGLPALALKIRRLKIGSFEYL
jgi:tRNA pseudouridine55 synthase